MALADNCIAYYKLSDPTDETGNHAGTNSFNPPSYVAGKIGNAANFNAGLDERITLANNFTLGAGSCSFWTIVATPDTTRPFFCIQQNGGGGYCWKIEIDTSGRIVFTWYPNTWQVKYTWRTTGDWHNASWEHIVVTHDGTTTPPIIYVNGDSKTVEEVSHNGTPSGNIVQVGMIGSANAAVDFNGSIDELGVWTRVLSSAEVSSLYNGGSGYQYPFTGGGGPDFTKIQINIGDAWKLGAGAQINIGDAWKQVAGMQINIGDAWKTIF
jgi:hypothetical protein